MHTNAYPAAPPHFFKLCCSLPELHPPLNEVVAQRLRGSRPQTQRKLQPRQRTPPGQGDTESLRRVPCTCMHMGGWAQMQTLTATVAVPPELACTSCPSRHNLPNRAKQLLTLSASPAFSGVIPPMATTGMLTAAHISASVATPITLEPDLVPLGKTAPAPR
jgi:hypothetical protein